MFVEYGLYKVGMDIENKVVIFYFYFLGVVKKFEEKIREFEKLIFWKVDINFNINLMYILEYVKNFFKDYNVKVMKFLYNFIINVIVIRIKEDFEEMKSVFEKFLKEFGVSLIFDVEDKK